MPNKRAKTLTGAVASKSRTARTKRPVAQTRPLPGREKEMVRNAAGGYGWQLDKWDYLKRFLVLGVEGGTFYATQRKLAKANAKNVIACIKEDGVKVVRTVVDMLNDRRIPKMDTALFTLGLCMKAKEADRATREAANAALTSVARIGTHVFDLVNIVEDLGGWGAGTRRAFGRWYNEKDPRDLAYQMAKYQQRNGVSHRDVLRLAHPVPASEQHDELFKYVTGKLPWDMETYLEGESPEKYAWFRPIEGLERAKRATTEKEIIKLIEDFRLTWEMIPTQWLGNKKVNEALLQEMPVGATIRQLGKMTSLGVIAPMSAGSKLVAARLTNQEALIKARIHPIAVLSALHVYNQGHGERGKLSWTPVPQIKDALDAAFDLSFGAVQPTGLNYMLGVDISGSMGGGTVAGIPGISPAMAAAAMAMVTARVEDNYFIGGFSTKFVDLGITKRHSIAGAMAQARKHNMGGTDAAMPLVYARKNKIPVDIFINYTDNETWAGNGEGGGWGWGYGGGRESSGHLKQALDRFRNDVNPNARMVNVAFTGTDFSLADPKDAGMLDCVGFDTATPQLISDFAMGEI